MRSREDELLLVVLATCAALAFHFRSSSWHVADEDYARVASVLEAEAAPGDVVFLHPWWTERARLFVPERLPVVGYLGSAGDELVTHPRIWLLSQPGLPYAGNEAFLRDFSPGRPELGTTRTFGQLRLSLHANERHRPALFSAVDALERARVYLERPDGRTPCPFDGRAHRCPGGSYVAAEWHEMNARPLRCLRMFPPGGSTRLVAELEGVPAGTWRLEGGIVFEWAWRKEARLTDTELAVEKATTGDRVLSLTLPPGLEGLQKVEVESDAGPIRIAVQARNPEMRESCLDFSVLGPSGASVGAKRGAP